MEPIHFTKLRPDAIVPSKATPGSIGLDLYSVESYVIQPLQRCVISTGIAVQIPYGFYGRIAPRSGLSVKNGIAVGAGVVDPDYTGEVRIVLFNHDTKTPYVIRPGYRIAQLIFEAALVDFDINVSEVQPESVRGSNGFGSTGV